MRRPSSTPMAGILTRSRAEVFVHRSRSGRIRPDPAGWKHLHEDPIHPSSLPDAPDIMIELSNCSEVEQIKSSDGLMSSIKDAEIEDYTCCEQLIRGESMQSTPPDVVILRRAEAVLDLEPLGKSCAEELVKASGYCQPAVDVGSGRLQRNILKNKHIIAQCSRSKLYQNRGSFGYRRLLPYLSNIEKVSSDEKYFGCEEIIPPSVPSMKLKKEIIGPMLINTVPLPALKCDIVESELKPERQTHDIVTSNVTEMYDLNHSNSVDSMVVGESIGRLPGDDDAESVEKHVTESSVSIPEATLCLHSKLYHNPNSFGYRRLQPYLRELEKDISGKEILNPNALDVEKKAEELPIRLSVDPCVAVKDDRVERVVGSPTLRITDTTENSKKSDSENSAPRHHNAALDMIDAESSDPSGQILFQAPMVSDLEMLQLRNLSSYPPSNYVTFSIKDLVGNTSDSQSSGLVQKEPLLVEPKLRRSGPGSLSLAPRKSLLKKQTRGCKGICSCLECASFRLHAERAFEFSRRQMLEVDDIVTALMNEHAALRKIAEKSASPQLKEVCRNALKVDQAAKSRMHHLIREMSIHCRHPGPRVKFADPIEEIRILESDKE